MCFSRIPINFLALFLSPFRNLISFAFVLNFYPHHHMAGNLHPQTFYVLNGYGLLHQLEGDLPAADGLLMEALAGRRTVFGAANADTYTSVYNLCSLRKEQGRLLEAEALCIEAVEGRTRLLGANHALISKTQETLSNIQATLKI